MADVGKRADRLLAGDASIDDVGRGTRAQSEAPLARRARLPRHEERSRPRPLRGSNMAGVPPSLRVMRGRPRIPGAPTSAFPPRGATGGRFRWSGGVFNRSCSNGRASAPFADAFSNRSVTDGIIEDVIG